MVEGLHLLHLFDPTDSVWIFSWPIGVREGKEKEGGVEDVRTIEELGPIGRLCSHNRIKVLLSYY